MNRVLLYAVLAAIVYYLVSNYLRNKKYLDYLVSELHFGIANDMTADEVKTSYIYLHDYARKYTNNASAMLKSSNPALWDKAKAISIKYKIFNV